MSTNTKLADKALQALVCMRGLQMHLGREVCEVEASELAAALADHKAEQAQPMFPKCASGTSEQAAQAVPADLRSAAERTRQDLGPTGSNYPDVRVLLAFAEQALAAHTPPAPDCED